MSDLKKEKHPTIHLHIYKGKKGFKGIAKDEKGNVINENHKVTLPHDTMEWNNWLKHVIPSGIIKIDVLGFAKIKYNEDGHYESYTLTDVPDNVKTQVEDSLTLKVDVSKMTPEQKEIAELKAMVQEMKSGGNGVSKEPKKEIVDVANNTEGVDELKALRAQYTLLNGGKKGSPKWDVEALKVKIEELSKQN